MSLVTNIAAYWKFDENTGSTVGDATGNGNGGTWQGTLGSQWGTGKINSGGVLNGSNNWVDVPDASSLDFTSAVTISAWIYKLNNNANQPVLSKRSAYSGTGIPYELTTDGTEIAWRVIGNTDMRVTVFNGGANLNQWIHIVATWDGTTKTIYLNGVSIATASLSGSITTNTHEVMIGTDNESNEWFDGYLDEIGLWSRGLSSSEVTQLYNSGNGLQYPFTTTTKTPNFFSFFKP